MAHVTKIWGKLFLHSLEEDANLLAWGDSFDASKMECPAEKARLGVQRVAAWQYNSCTSISKKLALNKTQAGKRQGKRRKEGALLGLAWRLAWNAQELEQIASRFQNKLHT
jgi:hypothetical protein